MDPVLVIIGVYRVIGSLFVLRWPFWGAILAVVVDLFDLLLLNLFVEFGGWSGFAEYQTFDKWIDQVYIGAFVVVAWRDFAPIPKRIAVALYAIRLIGFILFEAGIAPREALFAFPNLLEFWFIAVAFTMRFRPTFEWTANRTAVALVILLAAKLVQEWALHIARLFDTTTFLGALQSIWDGLTAPFRGG